MARVLIADDEEGVRSFLVEALVTEGYRVDQAADGLEAVAALKKERYDLVLLDLRMPGLSGLDVLRICRKERPDTAVVVLSAHGSVATAVEAMKLGAIDFLEKPIESLRALRSLVHKVLIQQKTPSGVAPELPQLSYGAPAMVPVVEALRKCARTQVAVLLLGESGTGKEVAARAIHAYSDRSKGPFIAVNCAALSDQLLESELFGHERGAFTGAHARHIGRLERAQGGTLFLDEIGELKPDLQARLLRVLQERSFERIGGSQTLSADVRFVSATNRDLRKAMAEGRFREDLYHRLAVFPIQMPPLRERRADIAPLARALLCRVSVEVGRPNLRLSKAAEDRLAAAPFPGNVRELLNVLQRAAVLCSEDEIDAAGLPMEFEAEKGQGTSLVDLEREAIVRTLREVNGNRRRAAQKLGIGLRTLYDKLKKYDLGE